MVRVRTGLFSCFATRQKSHLPTKGRSSFGASAMRELSRWKHFCGFGEGFYVFDNIFSMPGRNEKFYIPQPPSISVFLPCVPNCGLRMRCRNTSLLESLDALSNYVAMFAEPHLRCKSTQVRLNKKCPWVWIERHGAQLLTFL